MVLLASPLLDDMHECSVTLTLLQASKLLATMSCCKTAALPAVLSCTHVLPHCPTPYTPEEHHKNWTAQVQQHLSCIASREPILQRDVSRLVELEHAFIIAVVVDHPRISSLSQVTHSMIAVDVIVTGPAR